MTTITATYENGVFKPDGPVSLAPGAKVSVVLPDADPVSVFKARFPNSVGVLSSEEAEQMRHDIEEAFEGVDDDREC